MYTGHCVKVFSFLFFIAISLLYTAKTLFSSDNEQPVAPQTIRKSTQSSQFTGVRFFAHKDGKPYLKLAAVSSLWDPKENVQKHIKPHGVIIDDDSKELHYTAESGRIEDKDERQIRLSSKVNLRTDGSTIEADEINYNFKNEFFSASGNVMSEHTPPGGQDRVLVGSENLEYRHRVHRAIYKGDVKGKVRRKRAYEPGIDFSSSMIIVDLNKSHVEMKEKVFLKKQRVEASALHGEIFLENYNKKLKYYRLYDDVKVKESLLLRNGEKVERRAFAERLEGFNQTDRIVLTGSPKVIQQEEIIKGNKISLLQNNEVIEVDDASSKFIMRKKTQRGK